MECVGRGGGRSRSERCPQGSKSVTGGKNDAISREKKCNPKGKAAGLRKGMICGENLRFSLESANYLGIAREAKNTLMG